MAILDSDDIRRWRRPLFGRYDSLMEHASKSELCLTYQTRIAGYAGLGRTAGDAALDSYGELYGRVQRKLFAEVAAGRSPASL